MIYVNDSFNVTFLIINSGINSVGCALYSMLEVSSMSSAQDVMEDT